MYTTHTKYTYDEYKRFSEVTLSPQLRRTRILLLFLLLPVVAFSYFAPGYIMYAMIVPIFVLALLIFLRSIINRGIEKAWDSNKAMQNSDVQIVFDESQWRASDMRGNHTFEYDEIFKIVETKTNFYIFTAVNVATIIVKDNCSEELIGFIRNLKK